MSFAPTLKEPRTPGGISRKISMPRDGTPLTPQNLNRSTVITNASFGNNNPPRPSFSPVPNTQPRLSIQGVQTPGLPRASVVGTPTPPRIDYVPQYALPMLSITPSAAAVAGASIIIPPSPSIMLPMTMLRSQSPLPPRVTVGTPQLKRVNIRSKSRVRGPTIVEQPVVLRPPPIILQPQRMGPVQKLVGTPKFGLQRVLFN